jgi:hypothetical protein
MIALVTVVPKDKLTIKGPTKSWAGKGSSGHAVHRIFCSECGSPIAHDPDAAPEIIALKAGTLDTEIKKNLKPVCTIRFELGYWISNNTFIVGHRDLDCQQASLLPGIPCPPLQAHARVSARDEKREKRHHGL